jgi:hypothetical protein
MDTTANTHYEVRYYAVRGDRFDMCTEGPFYDLAEALDFCTDRRADSAVFAVWADGRERAVAGNDRVAYATSRNV